MKKILFIISLAICSIACGEKGNYKIAGFYENPTTNTFVYLLELKDGIIVDTLVSGNVLNGRFELLGNVLEEVNCRLLVEDEYRKKRLDSVDFILRGADFFAYLCNTSASFVIDNWQEADLASAFYRNEKNLVDRKDEILRQFAASSEERKDSLAQVFEQLIVDTENEENCLVKNNCDSRVAACAVSSTVCIYLYRLRQYLYSLGNKIDSWSYELAGWNNLLERYNVLDNKQKDFLKDGAFMTRLEQAQEKIERCCIAMNTSVGRTAPDMVLTDQSGEEWNLHGIQAKLKVVDFWASWCGPCRKTNPFMLDLWQKFKDKGLEIVSISVDERKEAWLKAIEEDKLIWRYNVRDLRGQTVSLYGITAVPCVLLLDENNKILGRDLPKDELHRIIKETLH